MKVLRVISTMDPASGGPTQGIRNSVPELLKLGVSNEVVTLDDPEAVKKYKDTFPVHAIGAAKGPWAFNKALLPWLLDNLSNYDVVIVHGLWLYHSYAVWKAIRQLRKGGVPVPKFCIMPHGMLDPYFQQAKGRRLKAIRNYFYWKLIEGHVVNSADAILFTCEEEKSLAEHAFSPYRPRKAINVSYGIKTPPPFNPEIREAFESRLPKNKPDQFLLFLSRIHVKKGLDELVEAYGRIKKEHPEFPDLVIAGPGIRTPYGQQIRQKAEKLTTVHFVDMLAGDAKWGAFYLSEGFVLSSHQENFGIAIVEALACGKNVIVSDKVNIWREIETAGAGLICQPTVQSVYDALLKWYLLPDANKEAMNQQALDLFNKHYEISETSIVLKDNLHHLLNTKAIA